jgi:hypothetical protein
LIFVSLRSLTAIGMISLSAAAALAAAKKNTGDLLSRRNLSSSRSSEFQKSS